MSDAELRRTIRLIVVQELTLAVKIIAGESRAASYAIDSLRAEQERERPTTKDAGR